VSVKIIYFKDVVLGIPTYRKQGRIMAFGDVGSCSFNTTRNYPAKVVQSYLTSAKLFLSPVYH
jgi:hypothetical protein